MLLRLHAGHEQYKVVARDALAELRKVWPEYCKPPAADSLVDHFEKYNRKLSIGAHFTASDLWRAARHDDQLRRLLDILGLRSSRGEIR